MPLYEYQCDSCGRRVELLQRLDEPPATVCPHCGGNLRKLVSAPAFQFKGSGWYVTDYARAGKGGAPKSDGGEAGAKEGAKDAAAPAGGAAKESGSGKGDAAPATPGPPKPKSD